MVPATNENSSVQELLVITGETKNSGRGNRDTLLPDARGRL